MIVLDNLPIIIIVDKEKSRVSVTDMAVLSDCNHTSKLKEVDQCPSLKEVIGRLLLFENKRDCSSFSWSGFSNSFTSNVGCRICISGMHGHKRRIHYLVYSCWHFMGKRFSLLVYNSYFSVIV